MRRVRTLLGQEAVIDERAVDTSTIIPAVDKTTGEPVDLYVPGGRVDLVTPAVADQANVYVASTGNEISLFTSKIPTANQFDQFTIPYQDSTDIITHRLYDSAALTSAAANSGSLFNQIQSSIYNGNMTVAGMLGSNDRFFLIGIRFELENNDASNPLDVVDVKETFRLGTYSFTLGSKDYASGKLMEFIDPLAPIVVNTKYYSVRPFLSVKLPIPIAIGKQMAFRMNYTLTAATLDNTTRLFCYLIGFHYRNVQ
jgi:hypothetical protein